MSLGKRLIQTSGEAACTTETVTAFGANAANSTNYAIYKLDGNSDDVTDNYDATNSVSFNSSGKFGQSATFNNTNTVIELPSTIDDPMRAAGAFTVSIWYKHATQTNSYGGRIVNLLNNIYNLISVHASDNTITARVSNSSNTQSSVTSSALSTGTWYHIVWTGNATNGVSLYIDSLLIGNAAWDGTFFSYTDTNYKYNRLGYQNLSIASLVGEIDQARFFNRAVISTEVAELYAETSSTTSNTNPLNDGAGVALYSLDYDASDTGGLYDGTPSNVDFGVGGQINTAARFNGSSSKIEVSNPVIPTGAASISFWYNANGNTGTQYILGAGVATASKGITVYLSEISTGNHSFGALVAKGTSSLAGSATGTTVYSTTSWHHVVCTWDGTTSSNALKVYVNNSLLAQGTIDTASASIGTYTNFAIGGLNGGTFADGTVDQVRIFSKVLTGVGGEVTTLYNEQACVHTSTTDNNDFPVTNAAYYKLDNSAEDSKGTNDGTESNIEYRFGRYGQAAVFNGLTTSSRSKITTSGLSTYNNFSISFWMNSDDLSNSTAALVMSTTDNNSSQAGFNIFTGFPANNNITWIVCNGSSRLDFTATDNLIENQWHHIVITQNTSDNTKKIYIDGSLSGTSTSSTNVTGQGYSLLFGGYSTFNNNTYDGKLDQVRIFASELSAANVTSLYNEKPETDTSNFKTVLWEGTGATQYISNVGMDLETSGGLVWLKARSGSSRDHRLFDSVRGATKGLYSNLPNAEFTESGVDSFEKNGFFLGSAAGINADNETFVGWVWKGGGTPVSNGNGSITSSVSANSAGFSIVNWTGSTSTSAETVGHGLSSAPELVILKNRDASDSWYVFANGVTSTSQALKLNTDDAVASTSTMWGAGMTSTVAGIRPGSFASSSSHNVIMYCIHSVANYSKVSTYSGTGSDGNQITSLGFKPSFILIKRTDVADNWNIVDNRRGNFALFPDLNSHELTNSGAVVFDTDGFTINGSAGGYNNSSGTYLYLAIK